MQIIERVKNYLLKYFKKRRNRRVAIFLGALLFFLYYPLGKPLLPDNYSRVITDKDGNIMRVFLNSDQQYCLSPDFIDTVPQKLEKAVIAFEDKCFYYHPGVNPVAIFRAFSQNRKSKKIVSGASTITMQLARIRKGRERNMKNKIVEISEAIRIEARYSKKKILKMYLDHAPYGGNIIGFQAASWRYFGKPANKISWAEACLLAVLPNSPGKISPVQNNQRLFDKRNRLLKKLYQKHVFDSLILVNSLEEPMPSKIVPFDLMAPHLTYRINEETNYDQHIVKTSIDPVIQQKSQFLVKRYSRYLETYGIKNAAVIVVDNHTRKIRAYIGSQDFYGTTGNVDGVIAQRSSGSILKPFLYGLAVQDGLIVPESQIQDIPTYYGTFSPSNASETYNGIVSAHDALVKSLNVPAVRLLYTYGHYKFYNFLKQAGVTTLFRSADSYGLPLIIGGAEVKLWDMASVYCGLANLGNFAPITYFENTDPKETTQTNLIDTLSCVLILNVLNDLNRPGAEYYWTKYNNQYPVAWKTGTSYGNKDAWAIGVNPDYTVAVWVGNFDATMNKNLSGAGSAGPLMFDVFDALPHPKENTWWNLKDFDFEMIEICAVTGYMATDKCDQKEMVPAPKQGSLKLCPYHMRTFVDKDTKYSVCSKCWDDGHKEVHYVVYPPMVVEYLRKNGNIIERIPVHNPLCPSFRSPSMIDIEYPKPNTRIQITRDFDGKYQPIIFTAAHQLNDQIIFWYIDDNYIGLTNQKHKMTVMPERGQHTLTLIDSYGNKKSVVFFITKKG